MKTRALLALTTMVACNTILAGEYSYSAIAERHQGSALDADVVEAARMQGECLVGLKELNFKKKDEFDPIAEWTNYRSISLLEQFPPCEVLIMMEVARSKVTVPDGEN